MNNKEEITVKKTTTENNPLKQNTSQPQKSSLKNWMKCVMNISPYMIN